jgi:hypothetical protein
VSQVFKLAGSSMGTSVIRLGQIPGWISDAELGAVGVCGVAFDDPAGTLRVTGWQTFTVDELDSPSGQQRIFTGYVVQRKYGRRPGTSLLVGASRSIDTTFSDLNVLLGFRLFKPTDTSANRPAETDIDRINWLLSSPYISAVYDLGLLNSSGPVALDAADLRGQSAASTFVDCSDASGKNHFLYWDESAGKVGLFYDFDYSAVFDCTLKLSNVPADIDESTTFAYEPDASLELDPGKVYAGVQIPFSGAGSPVYEVNAATEAAFGVLRDTTAPNVNVKTAAKAEARSQRYLLSLATEDERITLNVRVPSTKVGLLRAGMRIQFKASHMPDYGLDSFTWCRILHVEIRQDEETDQQYTVGLELSPPIVPAAPFCSNSADPAGSRGPNLGASSIAPGNFYYWKAGLTAPVVPTVGSGNWNFPTFNSGGIDYAGDCVDNHLRVFVAGNGTVTVPTLYGGGTTGHTWQAELQCVDPVGGATITLQTLTGNVGSPVVATITNWNELGGPCWVWLDIHEWAGHEPTCGSNWAGFSGFTWAPA